MQHQLHAARLVEKTFEHERVLRGDDAQRLPACRQIGDGLLGGGRGNARFRLQPFDRASRGPIEPCVDAAAKIADGPGQFSGPGRRFTQPEWQVRRRPFRVGDAHRPGADPQHTPGGVSELKGRRRPAFDREVLVERAR